MGTTNKRRQTARARKWRLMDMFREALNVNSKGWTMLCTKWSMAVKSKQKLRYNRMKRFSGSIEVSPFWRARMKNKIAETVPILRSSWSSTAKNACMKHPIWWESPESIEVMPRTAMTVSHPRTIRYLVLVNNDSLLIVTKLRTFQIVRGDVNNESSLPFKDDWLNMRKTACSDKRINQNILNTYGTCSLIHWDSRST